jgi:hypothetical protein
MEADHQRVEPGSRGRYRDRDAAGFVLDDAVFPPLALRHCDTIDAPYSHSRRSLVKIGDSPLCPPGIEGEQVFAGHWRRLGTE